MIKIRKSVFETNSSSTHSICISKQPVDINKNDEIYFDIGGFGWEHEKVNIKDYLYTAILCFDDRDKLLEKLKRILDKNNIKYKFKEPDLKEYEYDGKKYKYLDNGGIDHCGETRKFVTTVLVTKICL